MGEGEDGGAGGGKGLKAQGGEGKRELHGPVPWMLVLHLLNCGFTITAPIGNSIQPEMRGWSSERSIGDYAVRESGHG
jgi:hypothetical protein